jgi:methylamine--corrinoid protein Co-methyltransferase
LASYASEYKTMPRSLNVFDSFDRFSVGKKVREDTWDYVTIPKNALAMKEKYDISFGPEVIPEDDDLSDRLFKAGLEMLAISGFYNPNLGKALSVTEDEILAGVENAPRKVKLGRGRERVSCKPRRGNSRRKPIIQGGPTGAPVSEGIFPQMMESYAQERVVDTLVSGVLNTVSGRPSTTNTPWEIQATLAEIKYVREACDRAGRRGMGI